MEILAPIEPREYKKRLTDKTICTMDTETDPFGYDDNGDPILVQPFSVGFYDGSGYFDFWGDDCIDQFFRFLQENYEPDSLIIFVHNGGRFDFMFCLQWLNEGQSPFMIDGKIVKAFFGGQTFQDSYKLMPFPLAEYKKTEIDYSKFTRDRREKHKKEIRAYQRDDCVDLWDLCSTFIDEYGYRMTIASTALPLLNSYHGFETLGEGQDALFRNYYFGGRVQCFETGVIRTRVKVYDVNSMYAKAMRDFLHPVGCRPELSTQVGPNTFFICLVAANDGAFCRKTDDGSLSFIEKKGEFFVTIHEYLAGLKTGTMNPMMVKHCWDFAQHTTFQAFVDKFYNLRIHYRKAGDLIRALFVKYILNSSYGKLGQDPRRYEEFVINEGDCPTDKEGKPDPFHEIDNPEGWYTFAENNGMFVWARASKNRSRSFKNVATGASITGAARSMLLIGLSQTKRPLYCDTDSIICEDFHGDKDPDRVGAWKLEAEGDLIAIGGKKLYAIFAKEAPKKVVDKDDDGIIFDPQLGKLYCIKKASKGAHLTAAQIYQIAKGDVVKYVNPVPAFQLDGSAKITRRTIRRTT